ncbi:hypothetical protein BJ165DRAFT_1426649, partial [Panaeolus papilionaceus]
MEDTPFAFDFPYPESESQKELWRSFSSESSPCTLPRWFTTSPDFVDAYLYGGRVARHTLGFLHDYIRLYLICNDAESCPVDGFGSSCIYNGDTEPNNNHWSVNRLGVTSQDVAGKAIDPSTGRHIDLRSWSICLRWQDFQGNYTNAEREYIVRKYYMSIQNV